MYICIYIYIYICIYRNRRPRVGTGGDITSICVRRELQEPYIPWKEPYIPWKEPYILLKEPAIYSDTYQKYLRQERATLPIYVYVSVYLYVHVQVPVYTYIYTTLVISGSLWIQFQRQCDSKKKMHWCPLSIDWFWLPIFPTNLVRGLSNKEVSSLRRWATCTRTASLFWNLLPYYLVNPTIKTSLFRGIDVYITFTARDIGGSEEMEMQREDRHAERDMQKGIPYRRS